MMNIFTNFMVMSSYDDSHKAIKTALMPVSTQLLCCGQQRVSVDIVGKIAKPYICPGPDNANRSHHQTAGHHRHHSKDMLNPAAYLCSRLIALLFPLGEHTISAALAMQPFTKAPLLQQLYRLLRPIGGIGVYLSTRVGFLQKLIKHPAVMYRRIRHRVSADKLALYVHVYMVFVAVIPFPIPFGPLGIGIFLAPFGFLPVLGNLTLLYPGVLFLACFSAAAPEQCWHQ